MVINNEFKSYLKLLKVIYTYINLKVITKIKLVLVITIIIFLKLLSIIPFINSIYIQ